MDAIIAISLVDLSMQDCTLSDTVDALHSTFPKYPDFEYLCTAKKLLTRLNLYEMWQQELLNYGKLLQVDHKTLEADIKTGSCNLFARYDDVTDENVPLSASLVTSSYFNNKESDHQHIDEVINEKEFIIHSNNDKKSVVDNKLEQTLKKHSSLNKNEKKPPTEKKPNKRKRKEVTVDTSAMTKKKSKTIKNPESAITGYDEEIFEDDEEINDHSKLLDAVPSVNDFFTELGIDLKFENTESPEVDRNIFVVRHSTQRENELTDCETKKDIKLEDVDKPLDTITDESKGLSKTFSKLKQFQFIQKHDSCKYEHQTGLANVSENPIIKLENKVSSNNSSQLPKSQSSQVSIFETSDCDIDLDI